MTIVEGLDRVGDSGLAFPSRVDTPLTAWTTPKARLDADSGVEGWQLRDLRRTCRTGMAGLGVAPHIGERVLNQPQASRT